MSATEDSAATDVVVAGPTPATPQTDGTLAVYIDGIEVTTCCLSGSWTRRLNRPAQATVTLPMDCAIGDVGSRLRIDIIPSGATASEIVFHGFILNTETDTDKDTGTTVYNAQDPMELWQWRPVRADDGDFSKPTGTGAVDGSDLFSTYLYGTDIMFHVLQNTEGDSTAQGNGALSPPTTAEGPMFLTLGSFAAGATDISGAPVDWPMTIAELWSLLNSTGTVDLVITPTDPGGDIMGTIDGYNGDFGTDLSGSVVFEYGSGAFNAAAIRWNRDMTNMCNKYWLYSGPRVGTAADPAGDQHWCFNVTGDDTGLPGYPASSPYIDVINRRSLSQSLYGVRMKVDIFDGYDDTCGTGVTVASRELYRWQWITYSYFAATPREIIHVTPTRNTEIGTFDIGDLIGVSAVADVRGGFSGAQRVYEYTVSWDNDSVLTLSEIQTSADQE